MSLPAAATPVSFVFTADRARSLPFYRDVLGLELLGEDPFSAVFSLGGGATLRLTDIQGHVPGPHTVLGWEVTDLDAAMDALIAKGVVFRIYEGFGQDPRGFWSSPDGRARICWFDDPEGNNLSLKG
jgi:catechol 2,3-dioxygenase-like lactoylglutathione lyase family enzyme